MLQRPGARLSHHYKTIYTYHHLFSPSKVIASCSVSSAPVGTVVNAASSSTIPQAVIGDASDVSGSVDAGSGGILQPNPIKNQTISGSSNTGSTSGQQVSTVTATTVVSSNPSVDLLCLQSSFVDLQAIMNELIGVLIKSNNEKNGVRRGNSRLVVNS